METKPYPIRTAMILAAGLGLRLRPLTGARPKPLLPVLNKPLLYYWLERLQGLGVRRAVINAYHLAPMIVEAARNLPPGLGDIEALVSVEGELLGTAGGLKKAAMLLFPPGPPRASGASEPFYVVNGDIHTDIDLALLAETHQALASQAPHGPPVTMALVDYPPKATVSLGQDGQIVAFRHNGPCPGETSRLCGAGLAVMERWFLETLPGHFSDTVEILKGRMALGDRPGSRFFPGAAWADIGSLPEYYSLNKGLARGRALLQSPELVRGQLSGFVLAESGARVSPGAIVEDSVLLREACVGKGARVRGAVVAGLVPAGAQVDGGVIAGG